MARVLVVGGTGFVGSHAVRACVEAGHHVFVGQGTHRPGLLDDVNNRIQRVPANLLRWPELLEGLVRTRPDVVVCCAGYGIGDAGLVASEEAAPGRAVELNVGGLLNLLEAARILGVPRVIWTSSSAVYGTVADGTQKPLDEEAPARPTSMYGVTKAMAEMVARQYRRAYGLEVVGVRLPLVYGPGRWYVGQARPLSELFAAAAARRAAMIVAPAEPMDLMYAPDAGHLIATCVAAPSLAHDRYNVVGQRASIAELAQILRAIEPGLQLAVQPAVETSLPPAMSMARIARDLGFRPRYDAERACADYLASLRTSGAEYGGGAPA
jgi:nucleoside-diphosphate-sugar epimerase